MTTWADLKAKQKVRTHETSKLELESLASVVERDLRDAAISELSADRRFATAYNAVLQLSKMVIACSGYRVTGLGHHQTSFKAAALAIGKEAKPYTSYFELCRRKRNALDYDVANVATETEAQELLRKAEEFDVLVRHWLESNFSEM